jgi:ParB family chromosome partitioning protein
MSKKPARFDLRTPAKNPLLGGPSLAERARSGSPYREIPIHEIDVDPDQPRRVFEKEQLDELASSIREYGVLSPILVRSLDGGTFRLIAGERRLRAAKLAGLSTVPAVVDQTDDDQSILPKQLVENLQRADLTPMERALAFGHLRDKFGWGVREIARQLGVSKTLVQRSLEILSLPDDLQAALIAGAAESKILLLGQLEDRELRKELLEQIDTLTREDLEAVLAGRSRSEEEEVSHGGTLGRKKRDRLTAEDRRILEELQSSLGTKVQLARKANSSGGKLTIEFYSTEDLNDIYQRLTN